MSEDVPPYGDAPADDLQAQIKALVEFPDKPADAWITKIQGSPAEVIAGAIQTWVYRGGSRGCQGDNLAPRREAAQGFFAGAAFDAVVDRSGHAPDNDRHLPGREWDTNPQDDRPDSMDRVANRPDVGGLGRANLVRAEGTWLT